MLGEPPEGTLDRLLGEVRSGGDLVLGGFDPVGDGTRQTEQGHHDVSVGGRAVLGDVVQRRPGNQALQRVVLRVVDERKVENIADRCCRVVDLRVQY